jgi:hypothetical protein
MKTVVTVMAMILACSLNAQTISFGPTAGFGHSFLSIKNNTFDKKFFPSSNIGAKITYSIATHWNIGADMKLSGEGGKFNGDFNGDNYEHTYRADYIRIPFQGTYLFGKPLDAMRPKISVGPTLGFLIGGESTLDVNGEEVSALKTKDVFEGFDFGLNSALGVNFRLAGGKWLNADISYYHGFTNISATVSTIKNRNFGINIGMMFPIGNP